MEETKSLYQRTVSWLTGEPKSVKTKPTAEYNGTYRTLFSISYTGEKSLGELGPLKNYSPDHQLLRARSWDSYLTNEIVQIIVNRFSTWVIGKGLKLQSEPIELLLKSEGINIDVNDFSEQVEARFNAYSKLAICDLAGLKNLGLLENTAYKNAKVGGDVLVIVRYIEGMVKVQLIDGGHVKSPNGFGSESMPQVLDNGNRIMNGVEMNDNGEHVAYYVLQMDYTYKRIEVKGKKSGLKMAFLVSGLEYRIDTVRSIPAISTTLETLAKLDRYKEATLGSAEERQKIVYAIQHKEYSDGSSPLQKEIVRASGFNPNDDIPVTDDGVVMANKVGVSTKKQTFNMPVGSELKSLESKNELYFKDFYSVNFDLICSAFGMPPEVAASKYDSNFSSARAAIKDWEHTLIVERAKFAFEFMQPIYDFWLECQILENKISAPGYLLAKTKNNYMVLAAYRNARFVGANVPHIDPLKEVMAERAKLGDAGKSIPLTTVESATENLNGGESDSNIEQFATEFDTAKKLGIITFEKVIPSL